MNPEDVRGKHILIMGLGLHGGGAGAVEFFVRQGARVTVTDLRTRRELTPTLRALARLKGVRYVLGEHRAEDFLAADLIVKNPGVRRDSPHLKEALARGVPVTSDIAIFFALCPAQIVGVTGTRGKSTTTYLIWQILKTKFGSRVHYGGNIRRSVLGILPEIKKDDLVVLELSSFQLMDLTVEKKSPAVAVLTNIMRDHLNWHRGMREYTQAKSVVFRYQHARDVLFIPAGDDALRRLAAKAPGRVSEVRLPMSLQDAVDRNLGAHYRPAATLAVGVARHFGVAPAAIARTITAFKGLESRQHMIGTVRGVHFVDDTTATIPPATIAAIRRFRGRAGADHKLILIAGGQDKKLDFGAMIAEMKKSADAVVLLPGSATDRMMRELRSKKQELRIKKASSMKQAVHTAYRMARRGDYILLSPGATSFGLFLNEFDRGEQFARAVKALQRK
ncbi:MAG: UDP-N-acetylmuramoylalanine--D-glutamate ligase [Candidatus Sungbacteria bacterium RIFCSPHIGHO2_02_FULL_52_23]|uniref:UDP-N-acetylmuramoylalanine--D-glutamate ligase n=1 Tax=Candidatus Sungbacteria bacterium RIFCSPHIGHO2_02_FULL_52_23 TaxID=1802274 RepID=A0A1G2KSW2_9BACT|nr:MAG: UDP-N-acetylmuramoylalanine--D-glutamate ligase [Candidatus Sungbacteria bacterium RIFCSPHIGHO2_02_FULL_52_23]